MPEKTPRGISGFMKRVCANCKANCFPELEKRITIEDAQWNLLKLCVESEKLQAEENIADELKQVRCSLKDGVIEITGEIEIVRDE